MVQNFKIPHASPHDPLSSSAYDLHVEEGLPLLESVEIGMSVACELNYCADGVGPYGKVNEDGDITQDAMLMDGYTCLWVIASTFYVERKSLFV